MSALGIGHNHRANDTGLVTVAGERIIGDANRAGSRNERVIEDCQRSWFGTGEAVDRTGVYECEAIIIDGKSGRLYPVGLIVNNRSLE